jgi:hypothetical protein
MLAKMFFSEKFRIRKMLSRAFVACLCAIYFLRNLAAFYGILTDSIATSNLTKVLAYYSMSSHKMQESTYLLEKLARDAQHHAAEVLRLATCEQSSERRVAANVTRCTNTVGDNASFELDLVVFSVMTSKGGQRGDGLVMTISSHEPTR